RGLDRDGSAPHRLVIKRLTVLYFKRDVPHGKPMCKHLRRIKMSRLQGGANDKLNLPLSQHVIDLLRISCLRPAIRMRDKSKTVTEEIGHRLRVGGEDLDTVVSDNGERIFYLSPIDVLRIKPLPLKYLFVEFLWFPISRHTYLCLGCCLMRRPACD